MGILNIVLIIIGLGLFETISSVDNAIINAEVLGTMQPKYRRWFLVWGILFAVFVVRGLLPWLIIWASAPHLGFLEAFTAMFSNDVAIKEILEASKPVLLVGGGVFLLFLFFNWLFLEEKNICWKYEKFFIKQGVWFYSTISVILAIIVWHALELDPMIGFGAVVGSTAFFITSGFKHFAELQEQNLRSGKSHISDIGKILYLEILDATFSIDGVLGAFAFTMSIPLILVGNGLGAFVVRELTVRNVENIKKYKYLKNGAMYSVLSLGIIMVLEAFGMHIPERLSPLITFLIIGYFMFVSWKDIKKLKI